MASSDSAPPPVVRYWVVLLGVTLGALGVLGLFNLTADPYGLAEGAWYRLRSPGWTRVSDTTADRGMAARLAAARRGGNDVLLIGTSKTAMGFRPSRGVTNLGMNSLSLEEADALVQAATQSARPPRLIVIEGVARLSALPDASPYLARGWPDLPARLFSLRTTFVSLKGLLSSPASQVEMPAPGATAWNKMLIQGELIPFADGQRADILRQTAADLERFCHKFSGHLIIFMPPAHPGLLKDPHLFPARAARLSTYRHAFAASPSCLPKIIDTASPAMKTPAALMASNWSDETHFRYVVGDEILPRLRSLDE